MMRTSLSFLLGLAAGAGLMVGMRRFPAPSEGVIATPAPVSLECDGRLAEARRRITELEGTVTAVVKQPEETPHMQTSRDEDVQTGPTDEERKEIVSWRVSAVEKFVPLTEDQKNRLSSKFEEEQRARAAGEEPQGESLEEILGEENAGFYREQVKAAFQRMEHEENEREVVWLARQLNLSDAQEQAVTSVFRSVEESIDREFGTLQHGAASSPQDRVKRMIAENKRRAQLRSEQMRAVLSPEQYQQYLRSEAESSAADVEVFHDPGK
jgi:hypothetical protein